jgi:hypothetical protein
MRIFRRVPVALPWVKDRDVTLYDITRASVIPHVALTALAVVLVYYRGLELGWMRTATLGAAAAAFVAQPVAETLNLYHNGWGAPERRFWCHLRAMCRRGHNPMRWAFAGVIDACLLYATTGDAFAYTALALAYHVWCSAESACTPFSATTTDQDFAIALQPLHDEQVAVERGPGDPALVVAGGSVIFAALLSGHVLWALYLCAVGINTALYVRGDQTYVQTDLQARGIVVFRLVLAVLLF